MVKQNRINSLSNDLIIEILSKAAAHSFKDFINAKLCCRKWNELADDCNNVYKHISLPWFERKISERVEEYKTKLNYLLDKCADAGNHEALYVKGMFDYLEGKEPGYAMECLKKAANAGHTRAQYVICIISIFWGDKEEDLKIGTDCLKTMMESNEVREKSREFRKQLLTAYKNTRTMMYNNNVGTLPRNPRRCCTTDTNHTVDVECVSCKCDSHISRLYYDFYFYSAPKLTIKKLQTHT